MDGYTCSSYYIKMMNSKEWGSVLEIAAAAEMFQIGIRVFVPVPKKRHYKFLGSYRCFGFDENSREVFLLYSGYNHYDSLVVWSIGGDPLDTSSADYSSSNLGRQIIEFNTSVPMRHGKRKSCKQTMLPLRSSR